MKKILILLVLAISLNACRFIDTREKYVDERAATPLTIPDGLDKPNSTSTLEIPQAAENKTVNESSRVPPPDMPIRKKQSDDGTKRIDVRKGFPVIVAQVSKSAMWQAMNSMQMENWEISDSDESNCQVQLKYTDADAEERKNANFIKKIFTRDGYYTDYSGLFSLTCTQSGKVVETTFKKSDGSRAKSFLVDTVLENLYQKL